MRYKIPVLLLTLSLLLCPLPALAGHLDGGTPPGPALALAPTMAPMVAAVPSPSPPVAPPALAPAPATPVATVTTTVTASPSPSPSPGVQPSPPLPDVLATVLASPEAQALIQRVAADVGDPWGTRILIVSGGIAVGLLIGALAWKGK